MRPLISTHSRMWLYPLYATIGGGVGYWLEGVQWRQDKVMAQKKELLLEKRRRRLERDQAGKREGASAEEEVILAGA
jgi:hypothetical protein